MTNPTCATCRWWGWEKNTEEPGWDDCRRYPPKADKRNGHNPIWPVTAPFHFCGEHAPRVASDDTDKGG